MSIELYSQVRLKAPLNGHPQGMAGTVVEVLDEEDVLVELFDASERSVGVEDVPVSALAVIGEPAWRKQGQPAGLA